MDTMAADKHIHVHNLTVHALLKTWNALRSHLCRSHGSEQQPQKQNSSENTKINRHVCAVTDIPSVNDYFLHINMHLCSHETVS